MIFNNRVKKSHKIVEKIYRKIVQIDIEHDGNFDNNIDDVKQLLEVYASEIAKKDFENINILLNNIVFLHKNGADVFGDSLTSFENNRIKSDILNSSYQSKKFRYRIREWFTENASSFNGGHYGKVSFALSVFIIFSFVFGFSIYRISKINKELKYNIVNLSDNKATPSMIVVSEESSRADIEKQINKVKANSIYSKLGLIFKTNLVGTTILKTSSEPELFILPVKSDEEFQYLKLSVQSQVMVVVNEKGINLLLLNGSFYYTGHKGKKVTISLSGYNFELIGTKVFVLNKHSVSSLKVLEGKVRVHKKVQIDKADSYRSNLVVRGQGVSIYSTSAKIEELTSQSLKTLTQINSKVIREILSSKNNTAHKKQVLKDNSFFTKINYPDKTLSSIKNEILAKPKEVILKELRHIQQSLKRLSSQSKSRYKQIKIGTLNGSEVFGKILKYNGDELVLDTDFGKYRVKSKSIKVLKYFR